MPTTAAQQPTALTPLELLREAACVACLAPSIANSQPWRWRINGTTLELRVDHSKQLGVSDPNGQLMIISCGAALHHATVVLAVLGQQTAVDYAHNPDDPDLLATITLVGPRTVTPDDMRLHHGLRTRRTDRRPFLGTMRLSDEIITLLCDTSKPYDVATHVFKPDQVGFLAHAARGAARIRERDIAYREELAAWTTNRDPMGHEGIPADVAVPQVPRTVPVRDYAADGPAQLDPGPGDDRFTTYLALATHGDSRDDWLRTGQAISTLLITATSLGIASSLLSDVVEIPGARELLHAVIAPAGIPQLTVRLGVNESAPPLPATPRRPCNEVIEAAA